MVTCKDSQEDNREHGRMLTFVYDDEFKESRTGIDCRCSDPTCSTANGNTLDCLAVGFAAGEPLGCLHSLTSENTICNDCRICQPSDAQYVAVEADTCLDEAKGCITTLVLADVSEGRATPQPSTAPPTLAATTIAPTLATNATIFGSVREDPVRSIYGDQDLADCVEEGWFDRRQIHCILRELFCDVVGCGAVEQTWNCHESTGNLTWQETCFGGNKVDKFSWCVTFEYGNDIGGYNPPLVKW